MTLLRALLDLHDAFPCVDGHHHSIYYNEEVRAVTILVWLGTVPYNFHLDTEAELQDMPSLIAYIRSYAYGDENSEEDKCLQPS